jgi:hypothetical protein
VAHRSSSRTAILGALKVNVINYSYNMKNSFDKDSVYSTAYFAASLAGGLHRLIDS